ncbi:TrbC/VirB2 family protein [Wolbachia endosymbiont of Trichogramma pretiosum]|uniref:TrbC/VirB2 family protein n=1 Tax=Wolbachia endosymbiont of Trichogramma pretiosum TaxID=125593 RepID=UPI000839A544|nr:TrbC/VirB2 family protein [Wolbachia endosymbiont of Trichogramma pretiosum]OCA06722.1 trbC/VIRB2 family protein [Wolbachia endosymbiont of Trichogramma pretiosum]
MKNFLLLVSLILSFTFDNAFAADVTDDVTTNTICKIVGYTHGIGGPMITIVIIGAALLAIFGRMPWPALFALGAFTAVFFGAPVVVSKIVPGGVICKDGTTACPDGKRWDSAKNTCA